MAQRSILFGPLPPPYGGVGIFMSSLKEAAMSAGAEVWSYTGNGGDGRVTVVDHRRFGHIRRLMRVPRTSRIVDSSHFHLEYPHSLLLPPWLRLKKQKGFTWIKVCHDGSFPSRYREMSDAQKRRTSRAIEAVDELVVTSEDLVDFFLCQYDVKARFISPLLPESLLRLERTKPRGRRTRILSIGTFIPSYGFHQLADAIEILRSEGRDIALTIIDGNFARDDNYRRSVLKGRDWISVRESLPKDEVMRHLAEADIFVRAVEHESYGLSRVEAVLAGVPVIATDVGETRGMLTYGFGDTAELIRHIKAVLDDSAPDLGQMSEIFRREAAANLKAYIGLLKGDADA